MEGMKSKPRLAATSDSRKRPFRKGNGKAPATGESEGNPPVPRFARMSKKYLLELASYDKKDYFCVTGTIIA